MLSIFGGVSVDLNVFVTVRIISGSDYKEKCQWLLRTTDDSIVKQTYIYKM